VPAEEAGEVAPPKPAVPSWHDRDERDDVTLDADGIPV
jgi:hypothetical protein